MIDEAVFVIVVWLVNIIHILSTKTTTAYRTATQTAKSQEQASVTLIGTIAYATIKPRLLGPAKKHCLIGLYEQLYLYVANTNGVWTVLGVWYLYTTISLF